MRRYLLNQNRIPKRNGHLRITPRQKRVPIHREEPPLGPKLPQHETDEDPPTAHTPPEPPPVLTHPRQRSPVEHLQTQPHLISRSIKRDQHQTQRCPKEVEEDSCLLLPGHGVVGFDVGCADSDDVALVDQVGLCG